MATQTITINNFNTTNKDFSVTSSIDVNNGDTVEIFVEDDGTWPFGAGSQTCTLTFNETTIDIDPFNNTDHGSTSVQVSNGGTSSLGTVTQSVTVEVADSYTISISDYSVDPDIIVDPE